MPFLYFDAACMGSPVIIIILLCYKKEYTKIEILNESRDHSSDVL